MHRFYLPPEQSSASTLTLTGAEAHHALRVLRVRRGERVIVLDGVGHEFLCEISNAAKDAVQLAVIEKKAIPALPCQITLLQAIPKGKIIEDIIQKATELGAHRIVPILSERVTTRLEEAGTAEKAGKWRLVAIEAIKQCGLPWLPRVDLPMTPEQFLARREPVDLALVASLQPYARNPREPLREFQSRHGTQPRQVCVWIGPEGDFTPDELRAIQNEGAQPISLGNWVLRVETAAISCLSYLNLELQTGR